MSDIAQMNQAPVHRARRAAGRRLGQGLLALAAVTLVSGCVNAQRNSVEVGATPDDYRTNHPIVIAESDQVLDLPVGASAYAMTQDQRRSIEGFLGDYDPDAAPWVTILVPAGSANEEAALDASSQFAEVVRAEGVPPDRVMVRSYHVASSGESAPVRMSYAAMKAQTGQCGRWPDDILETTDNRHYANFGCAYQNNLAAQVANPADFLGPRKSTPIDAENRDTAIGDYKTGATTDDFNAASEIEY